MEQEIFDEISKAARNNPTLSTVDIISEALHYVHRPAVGRHDNGGNAYRNLSTTNSELLFALKKLNRMRLCV